MTHVLRNTIIERQFLLSSLKQASKSLASLSGQYHHIKEAFSFAIGIDKKANLKAFCQVNSEVFAGDFSSSELDELLSGDVSPQHSLRKNPDGEMLVDLFEEYIGLSRDIRTHFEPNLHLVGLDEFLADFDEHMDSRTLVYSELAEHFDLTDILNDAQIGEARIEVQLMHKYVPKQVAFSNSKTTEYGAPVGRTQITDVRDVAIQLFIDNKSVMNIDAEWMSCSPFAKLDLRAPQPTLSVLQQDAMLHSQEWVNALTLLQKNAEITADSSVYQDFDPSLIQKHFFANYQYPARCVALKISEIANTHALRNLSDKDFARLSHTVLDAVRMMLEAPKEYCNDAKNNPYDYALSGISVILADEKTASGETEIDTDENLSVRHFSINGGLTVDTILDTYEPEIIGFEVETQIVKNDIHEDDASFDDVDAQIPSCLDALFNSSLPTTLYHIQTPRG